MKPEEKELEMLMNWAEHAAVPHYGHERSKEIETIIGISLSVAVRSASAVNERLKEIWASTTVYYSWENGEISISINKEVVPGSFAVSGAKCVEGL